MHRSVAGGAGWGIRIARFCSAPVNALGKFLDFSGVAVSAFFRLHFGRRRYFMGVAVARGASRFAQHGVDALRHRCCLIGVAGRALDFGDFCGMREILDRSVTVFAAKDSMHARSVFLRADGNIHALFRFHFRLAVASEASFILFQGLRRFFLSASE
jgi:hypothetical protein